MSVDTTHEPGVETTHEPSVETSLTRRRLRPAIPPGPVKPSEIGLNGSEADDYRRLIAPFITPVSYRPPAKMKLKEWTLAVHILVGMRITTAWWIGDALAAGERLYGDADFLTAMEIAAAGRLSRETLLDYKYVALHVAPERRRPELPFGIHREVAAVPPDVQTEWLDKAATGGQDGEPMSRTELRRIMRAQGVGMKGRGSIQHAPLDPPAGVRALRRAWQDAPDEQRRAFIEWSEPEWPRIAYRPPEEQLRIIQALREGLRQYGAHHAGCDFDPASQLVEGQEVRCSCGFLRTLAL